MGGLDCEYEAAMGVGFDRDLALDLRHVVLFWC
jgi:hypothetical protein